MRVRVGLLLLCALLVGAGAGFLTYKRLRYSIVGHEELVAVRKKLGGLSPEERRDLAYFVNRVVSWDQFPYVLVGDKPMSIGVVIVEETEDLPEHSREALRRPNHQRLRRGYLVWKKYESLFPRRTYALIDYSFLGTGRKEIALIYPALCRSAIQENLSDFQEILGQPCESREVFGILTHPEHPDFHKIIDHTRLVGILLGFGRSNACLYEKYRGGSSRSVTGFQETMDVPLQAFSNKWPWPGVLLPPNFACDPTSEETVALRKRYEKASQTVRWTYFLRNKLEVTLALLER